MSTDSPAAAHEHVLSKWMVYDRQSKYRTCVVPDCPYTERRQVGS